MYYFLSPYYIVPDSLARLLPAWRLLSRHRPSRPRENQPQTTSHPSVRYPNIHHPSSSKSFFQHSDAFFSRYAFTDAIAAFDATKKGKSEDGKGVIKAIISGPDVAVEGD
jgi:hypothetical protein